VLLGLLLIVIQLPLSAAAQTGVELEAVAGLGGYVAGDEPLEISVSVTSETLFSGQIVVNSSGAVIRVPVEIPAGSTKVYGVTAPPFSGQVARVRLYAEGVEKAVATTSIQLRLPGDDLVVGVAGLGGNVVEQLRRTRTQIGAVPVVPVVVTSTEVSLAPLGYLVADDLGAPEGDLLGWIEQGGRVVTGAADLGAAGTPLGEFQGGTLFSVGRGEVLVVPGVADLGDRWASVLRPVPIGWTNADPWSTPERALAQAASNSGGNKAQSLPWLLAALAGYALLVGPVNLIVLKRINKRDLAWVTIPVISLVAVTAFWLAGRQRLEQTETTHASVVIDDGSNREQRSVVVLATGKAGSHVLEFEPSTRVYPTGLQFFDAGQGLSGVSGQVSGSEVTFDLPQLGFGAVQAIGSGPAVPSVRVVDDKVEITNDSGLEFWAWGVGGAGRSPTASGEVLSPGETATTLLPSDQGFFMGMNLGDQVVQTLALWDDERAWQLFYPLGEVAGYLTAETDLFFYGYVENYPVSAGLDGQGTTVNGPAIVVVAVSGPPAERGQSQARLLSAGLDGFIEGGGPGFQFVNSSEMFVSLTVPTDVTKDPVLRFRADFGPPPAQFQVWDWEAGEFVEVGVGEGIGRSRHLSPTGEIVIRAGSAGEADVEGEVEVDPNVIRPAPEVMGMSPGSIFVEWVRA
jgi:hypothetical protein